MNQILVTGDEQISRKVTEKVKKEKKVLPINGIVAFYAIAIIILGMCMICGSVYAKEKINETVEASIKPEITVERNDDDNTLQITVTHKKGLKDVTYQWNDEQEITVNGQNKTSINEIIDLIGGENVLKVSATGINNQIKTFEKTFIAGNIPEIQLEAVANGVKIIATSEDGIDYVQYGWDDEETQKIEVKENQYEGIINAPKGEHILKIEVVDVNGMKAEKEQKVVGDTEPTLTVKSKTIEGKRTFVIDIEDDEEIKTLSIIHNGGERQIIEINAPTYHHEITMTEGEVNTLIITATNRNGLSKTRRVKSNNE